MFTLKNPEYQKARERAEALLEKMTLEEKIIQLTQYIGNDNTYNPESKDEDGTTNAGRCGSFLAACGAETVNALQKIALEYTPHSVPIITGNDVIHGFKTTMPIPLAMSCTFEPDIIRNCFRVAGEEARNEGVHWAYAPMVDTARDCRWGRVAEGFGEDPMLASDMAAAAVHGYQDDAGIMACMKHFVAYSNCDGGRDYAGCELSDHALFNTFIPPFQAGVDAGVATFMSSFNEINGVPCSGSRHILTEVLRERMGFDGFVVSDYDSVHELIDHGYAEDMKDAAYKGFHAGVDVVMSGNLYNKYLPELVREGKISEEEIDRSVLRVLAAKYLIGVMDEPFVKRNPDYKPMSEDNLAVSYRAAVNSMVLLENNGVLPYTPKEAKGAKIGLCGPVAADRESILGCWASVKRPKATVTIKAAFEEKYPDSEIVYAEGVSFDGEGDFTPAVEAMANCDIIFAALGEHCSQSGECTSKTDLSLPAGQLKFLDALCALGKPVVLLISAGRPLIMAEVKEKVSALLYIWAPGTCGGAAAADIISGEYNPSGKLTISFPYAVGQLPLYYNQTSTGRPASECIWSFASKYIDCPPKALYPFGYGMSYTKFDYSAELNKTVIAGDEELKVSVTVKNSGNCGGTDVVQLYVRDMAANVTRPVKELKAYRKLYLEAGEEKNFTFTLKQDDLAFWNSDMVYAAEPGRFKLWVAHHSDDNEIEFSFELK